MKKPILPPETEIEVVATKHMTMKRYDEIRETFEKKGWRVLAYQKGFRK